MYDKSQSYTLSVSFYRRYNRYNYKSVSNLETDIWVVSFLELNSMTKDLILFLYAISISAMHTQLQHSSGACIWSIDLQIDTILQDLIFPL